MNVAASLAIAANIETALLVARNLLGVTIILPGQEADVLGPLSVAALTADPDLVTLLQRWGVSTLGELAALPEPGVRERLGEAGCRLRRLALGCEARILRMDPPAQEYTARQDLDHLIDQLEPLLFIISAQLHEQMRRLTQNGCAVGQVTVILDLEDGGEFTRTIQPRLPMRDPKALLKQIQLSLEEDPPKRAIAAVRLTLEPAEPRTIQNGLFVPAAPEPEKLESLLMRLRALVGDEHVGSPELLNTHRPDAYRIRPCAFEGLISQTNDSVQRPLRLALRYFRPPIAARVQVRAGTPHRLESPRIFGVVLRAAGPWPTSGEWWTTTRWDRREWDVALDEGGLYRICEASERWFIDGSYD